LHISRKFSTFWAKGVKFTDFFRKKRVLLTGSGAQLSRKKAALNVFLTACYAGSEDAHLSPTRQRGPRSPP
jgi:hypothetical protein